MESNKEEAYRSASLGKRSLADGDVDRALRFLNKAAALYPCPEVRGRPCRAAPGAAVCGPARWRRQP